MWRLERTDPARPGKARTEGLVRLPAARNALVNRLAAGKSFLGAVPVRDRCLAQLPAQQDDLALDFAGKVQQADVEILHLDSDRVNFGEGVFRALLSLSPLGLASGHREHVDV